MFSDDKVILHQTLHGYRDGHRLLNQSVDISPQAAKTLLVMSDASGPNFPSNHSGYITGYPVPDTKFYAIAKTWPASEQSRPGCVWTHTILIDISDLGIIKNTALILKQFKRPEKIADYELYEAPLIVNLVDVKEKYRKMDLKFLREIFLRLYGKPQDPVLIDIIPSGYTDSWIVSIWGQQWPRLKRTFRFCTLVLSDRSTPEAAFDLQIIPSFRESRSKWKNHLNFLENSFDADMEQTPEWIRYIVDDLIYPENTTIREFLWRYGADTEGGRAAFATLANVWVALESHNNNLDYDVAVASLAQYSKPIPTLTKYLIAELSQHVLRNHKPSKTTLRFLTKNISQLNESLDENLSKPLAEYIWNEDRELAWSILRKKNVHTNDLSSAFTHMMTSEEAIAGTRNNKQLLAFLITHNTELADNPKIWRTGYSIIEPIAKLTKKQPEVRKKVINAMIQSELPELAASAFEQFGEIALIVLIANLDKGKLSTKNIEPWLTVAAHHTDLLFPILASGKVNKIKTLSVLSTNINPCHSHSDSKIDCWVRAIDAIKADPIEGGIGFCTFLLARSLCRISSESGRLAQLGFDPVYRAAEKLQLNYDDKNKIRDMLPHAAWFVYWNLCYRISAGVAQLFVDENLPYSDFFNLTTDDKLFKLLVDRVMEYENGNYYLEKALKDLPKSGVDIKKTSKNNQEST